MTEVLMVSGFLRHAWRHARCKRSQPFRSHEPRTEILPANDFAANDPVANDSVQLAATLLF